MIASKRAERVDLGREILGGGDAREIADHDRFGLGQGLLRVRGAGVAARMQDHPVALIGEKLADHQSEAVGRTGDEDASHSVLLELGLAVDIGRLASAGLSSVAPKSNASSAPLPSRRLGLVL